MYRSELNLNDFQSRDGSPMPPQVFDNVLQLMRHLTNFLNWLGNPPVMVNSGYRSPSHNENEGGHPRSRHLYGQAVDFQVQGFDGTQLATKMEEAIALDIIPEGGLGYYNNFSHYDIRGKKARWDKRTPDGKDYKKPSTLNNVALAVVGTFTIGGIVYSIIRN